MPRVGNVFAFLVILGTFIQLIFFGETEPYSKTADDLGLPFLTLVVDHIHQQHQLESVVPLLTLITVSSDPLQKIRVIPGDAPAKGYALTAGDENVC